MMDLVRARERRSNNVLEQFCHGLVRNAAGDYRVGLDAISLQVIDNLVTAERCIFGTSRSFAC